ERICEGRPAERRDRRAIDLPDRQRVQGERRHGDGGSDQEIEAREEALHLPPELASSEERGEVLLGGDGLAEAQELDERWVEQPLAGFEPVAIGGEGLAGGEGAEEGLRVFPRRCDELVPGGA